MVFADNDLALTFSRNESKSSTSNSGLESKRKQTYYSLVGDLHMTSSTI